MSFEQMIQENQTLPISQLEENQQIEQVPEIAPQAPSIPLTKGLGMNSQKTWFIILLILMIIFLVLAIVFIALYAKGKKSENYVKLEFKSGPMTMRRYMKKGVPTFETKMRTKRGTMIGQRQPYVYTSDPIKYN